MRPNYVSSTCVTCHLNVSISWKTADLEYRSFRLFTQMRFEPMEILLVTFFPETVLVHTSSVQIIKRSCILACVFICWIFQYFLLVLTHSLFNWFDSTISTERSKLFVPHCPLLSKPSLHSTALLLSSCSWFSCRWLWSRSRRSCRWLWLYFNFSTEVNTWWLLFYVCNVIYPV